MSLSVALVAGPDPGHAFNAIGLGVALASRGHDVTVATGSQHLAAISGEGLRFVELPLLAPTPQDVDLGHLVWRRAGEMASPLAELLRPLRIDVVVSDVLTRAGAFAAELLEVPWVELSPHHLMDPHPDVPPVGMGRAPARTWWRRRSDDRIRRAQEASFAAGADLEREIREERLGLPCGGGAPAVRLLCTLPALEHPRSPWPSDVHVVGPMGWEPPWARPAPPAGVAPLVVVTDSTASTIRRSLAETAVDGLRHAGVRAVVTTGADLAVDEPWLVAGRAPHGPLLDHATVAVGPGGGGFVAKALVRGVPLVVVPLMGDQRETAGRIRHAGLGVWLPPRRCTPTTLRIAVERVLTDDGYARRAATVAADARARGLGPDLAAGLVEAAATGTVPPSSGPHG